MILTPQLNEYIQLRLIKVYLRWAYDLQQLAHSPSASVLVEGSEIA
jgi:hypothetical protein